MLIKNIIAEKKIPCVRQAWYDLLLPKIDPPFQKLKQFVCLCLNVLSIHVYLSYVIAIAMIIFFMNLQVIRIPKIYKCMLVALQNGCSFHRKYFIFSLEFMYQTIGIFLNNIF